MAAIGDQVTLMSDDLLQKLALEQAPEAVKGYGTAEKAGLKDRDVLTLRVDFKNILRIDNLWSFPNLTKLQLDNNLIEKIENIESLVHLEWLDLSFNQIEFIEGLDKLTKLKDLTLHHNNITVVENLDTLQELECFSIGENQITSLEDPPLLYLRRFKRLKMLNMTGNPVCEDENYEAFILAHLPTLKYFDYQRVIPEVRDAAIVQYQDQLEIIQAKEAENEEQQRKERELNDTLLTFERACVPGLQGDQFFIRMLDAEIAKLMPIPGIKECTESFKEKFVAVSTKISDFAVEQLKIRDEERDELFEAVKEGLNESNAVAANVISGFLARQQEVANAMGDEGDAVSAIQVEQLHEALSDAKDNLMGQEIDLVAAMEETINVFERNATDLVAGFLEQVQADMADIREMEENYFKEVTDISVDFLEKFSKGELDGPMDIPEELLQLLRDKSTISGAIAGAHDNHTLEIDTTEDKIITSANDSVKSIVTSLAASESKRNRARIAEICNFYDYQKEILDQFE